MIDETPENCHALITMLFYRKEYKKAIELADRVYELYPNNIEAIVDKIKALTHSGKMMEAEKLCLESLTKFQNSAALWFQMGFLQELIYCDDRKAIECYKAAAELGNAAAEYNIAVAFQKLGEYSDAEVYYQKMLEKFSDDVNAITSLGMCYLTQKKFKEGYELFFRRDKSRFKELSNNFWQPNAPLEQELNIICDQGFGDHIMFARYLKFLSGKRVHVGTRTALMEIFSNNFPDVEFVRYEDLNPDLQTIFITDLPYALNMDFENIPFGEGYLTAAPADVVSDKIKVGFCWEAGAAGIRTMINRTINVKFFEPVFNLENIQAYSFQFDDTLGGNEKYLQMINLAKDFKSFNDTAKALKAMDVVVTVDTSVAHLAGALGVKTFLLLPYASDWRWFADTKTTPWYKSVEIFKQQDHISWEKEINEIIGSLTQSPFIYPLNESE